MTDIKSLHVLDIYLDLQNPRHLPMNTQKEIITYLLENEQIKNLAKDIAYNGISQIDFPAVMKDNKGNYIMLEGNRRLCALILLNNPDIAPSDEQVDYFKKIVSNSSKIPSRVKCVVFDNREEANISIERRHGGEQNGIGTKQWDATQKSRHMRSKNKADSNSLALGILEYAKTQGLLSEKDESKILTTVSRYLGNPYFRKTLGIVSRPSDLEVTINVSFGEFDRVIKQFLNDLLDKDSGVNSRTKKSDWENYANLLITNGIAPTRNRCLSRKMSPQILNFHIN